MKYSLIGFILILLLGACTHQGNPTFSVKTDEEYNTLFTRTEGWTGGDVACTVPLSGTATLWLFGDSWIGPVVENRHSGAVMINNAVAIQQGTGRLPGNLKFYHGETDGKAASLFTPPDENGYFWLTCGGIRTDKKLYLIASQIVKVENDSTVFGFKGVGNWIFSISNPMDQPDTWKVEMTRMPFYENDPEGTEISFGAPQFIRNGYIYVYGTCFIPKEINRYMLLARVTEKHFLNFAGWEFYTDGKWQPDFKKASKLCDQFGAEYSVSWQPTLKKYISVYSELGMSEKIMMRTAAKPEGPWSDQQIIYLCPETGWDKDNFCYAARAHPELSGRGEILISYICNSMDFWKMAADVRIYRPKFIRVTFSE